MRTQVSCDALAKWSSSTVHWLRRQHVDLRQWKKILPNLWCYFKTTEQGLPPLHADGYFCPTAPALPSPTEPGDSLHTGLVLREISIVASFASANVQTLGKGPDGHAGKLDYIQQQFVEHGVCVIGVQEARTDESFATMHGPYLRLASGSDRGHHGVELWLSKTHPFGYDNGVPCYFRPQDVIVLHRDPRRLLARITHPCLEVLLMVLHAPQSGREYEERKEWWQSTTELVARHYHLAPVFIMLPLDLLMTFIAIMTTSLRPTRISCAPLLKQLAWLLLPPLTFTKETGLHGQVPMDLYKGVLTMLWSP